ILSLFQIVTYLLCLFFFFQYAPSLRHLHSFPTRRSSDISACGRSDNCFHPQPRGLTALTFAPFHHWFAPAAEQSCPSGDEPQKRSEEHTSELQSRGHLVCRLLLEKKKYGRSGLVTCHYES